MRALCVIHGPFMVSSLYRGWFYWAINLLSNLWSMIMGDVVTLVPINVSQY